MVQEIFRMERVTYRENEVTMLEDFNLQIDRGEILGLSSLSGHGLSSLLRLMEKNLPLYDGYVYYCGELVNSWKGAVRPQNRISVIGAENRLVDALNVTDNIFVLRQGFRQEIIRNRLLRSQLAPFLKDIDMDLPLDLPVEKLSVFDRVILELLRAVVQGHQLIVLNEIGTLISYEELEKLHQILRHYTEQGFSFFYICPHYEELARICGRVLLLSNGRVIKALQKDKMSDEIIRFYTTEYERMVRFHLEKQNSLERKTAKVLELHGIHAPHLEGRSLDVMEGECLVLKLQNNDMFLEARELLTGGVEASIDSVRVGGKDRKKLQMQDISVISELATKTMIFPEISYMENLCISLSNRIPSIWMNRRIRRSIRKEYEPVLGKDVFDLPVEQLSERQKYQLVYTRVLLAKPRVVFCIQPFKGADLPHRMFIWKMLDMLLEHGIAVVILSLTISDSLSLADRLLMVGKDETKEIYRENFAAVPEIVPWMFLYRE